MTEPYISDYCVVLKRLPLNDADANIVLLGNELGKFVALAKGVAKPDNKRGASLDVGSYISANIYDGKSGYTLLSVSQVTGFTKRFEAYEALLTSVAICDLVDGGLEQGLAQKEIFELLVTVFKYMDDQNVVEMRLLFEWEFLRLSGYTSIFADDFYDLFKSWWKTSTFSLIQQSIFDELYCFFSQPFIKAQNTSFSLSRPARKTMRALLKMLLEKHLSLRLKSFALLDEATQQFL